MSRVAKAIEFTNSDINRLNNVVHNDLSSPESVKRCKAILLAIEGKNNKTIASDLGVRENTVSDWRKVWKNGGINALLSISHTGRPRSEARKAIEEELSKDARANDHAVLREKTGASESTVYRALAEKNSSTCTMSVAMDTMPKHVDICGLYISSSESAAILRVTDKEVALSNGEMIVYSEKTAKVIDDARSEDGHIQLTKALSALTAHASDVGAVSRKSGMQTFLASLVPALPDDNNDVYYVIYSSMNPNCTRPTLARMNMRTNCVATIDIWLSETGFWINMLSRDDEMAREFGLYTREYLAARLPDSEPFQWYRHDITPQNIIAIESNDFADPSVNSVVTITATIQNRDGTQATVESKVCNAVPAAKDIQYSDVLEFSGSLGTLDTGLGNVFRQAQCQLMESYIGEASKKKTNGDGLKPCEAETEAGRIRVLIPSSLKNAIKPLQRIWSSCLRRMTDKVATIASYGDTTNIMNEFLHRDGKSKFVKMTIEDTVIQDGRDKQRNDERFVREVFTKTPWLTEKGLVTDINAVPDAIRNPKCTDEGYQLACKKRDEVVAAYNKNRVDAERISDKRLIELIDVCPESTVYIMADSVIASKQKEHRNVNGVTGTTRDKKTVNVANVYILSKEGVCYITAQTEEDALKMALAYVVHHDMLSNRELVFFADGANTIKNNVKKYFGFRKYDYILDWYHLRKKCYELFTMALSGGKKNKERNAKIRYGFEKILWAGNTEEASAYLDSLKTMEGVVKSDYYLGEIKKYISEEKKGDSITSYALRSELEMVNSSSRCEKQNDLEFADRCKNNGMSWSDDGSIAIAQVTNLFLNHEDQTGSDPNGKTWFQTHEARYEPTPLSEEMKVYMHLAS